MMSRPRIYLVLGTLFAALATAIIYGEGRDGFVAWVLWMHRYSLALVASVLLLWLFLGLRRHNTRGIRTILLVAVMLQLIVTTAFVASCHFGEDGANLVGIATIMLSLPGLAIVQSLGIPGDYFFEAVALIGFTQWCLILWVLVSVWNRTGAKIVGRSGGTPRAKR